MILGTAGHIDHGKTALIKALTGIDTDRLKEEKERGISIDLGFAHFEGDDGERAGVVDVPGHERFIRNMLAGVHGIDLVLLVVAADDGVMPQTEEHADILHLLGVRRGIIALTKVDLVDGARRAAVREEIEILLAGTTLEGAPIIEVSSATGEGIEALREAIRVGLRQCARRKSGGYFRLPADRAFGMRGHGLVVTGTAIGGTVQVDATVRILPGGKEARVRSIQVHGEPVEHAECGQRIALNLVGVGPTDVTRGHVVCAPQLDRATSRFDAWVELRPAARRPLKRHSLVRVHLGTAEVMGKVVWLDGRDALKPKESTYAQLALRQPVAGLGGDRFILRDQTARSTIGGGRILDPFATAPGRRPGSHLSKLAELDHASSDAERLTALLALQPVFAVSAEHLAAAANLRAEDVRSLLAGFPDVRPLPDGGAPEAYTSVEKWTQLSSSVYSELVAFHGSAPTQAGMEMESLRSRLAPDLSAKIFRIVVAQLEKDGVLVREQSVVRLTSHTAGLGAGERRLADQIVAWLDEEGFTPSEAKQIAERLGIDLRLLKDLLAQIEREGRVVRVTPDLCYAATVVDNARELIRRHVADNGLVTAAAFRDLIGASRKYSIALLTYFDRTGFTIRVGDVRKLRSA
jgi:selenocysteine-specific elongation factor